MSQPESTTVDAAPARGRSQWWSALGLSLLVTAAAALFSLALKLTAGTDWSVVFVVSRWMVVFALLLLPLLHQLVVRRGSTWNLPWSLRTPATGLLLTIEGIAWDIIAAHSS
ncbi:MAG: hypothetical protein KDC46_07665 [Thermoleophilia bacterium]|nr:hypothetical protein [Thermoleophilia bacterium]